MEAQDLDPSQTISERIKGFSKKAGDMVIDIFRVPDPQARIRKRIEKNKANGRDPLHGFRRLRSAEASFHPYPGGNAYPARSISGEGNEGEITPDDRLADTIPPSS